MYLGLLLLTINTATEPLYVKLPLPFLGPSHYVVHFHEDDCIACVPKKHILRPTTPTVGDECCVRWSDGTEYTATVMAMGEYFVGIVLATHEPPKAAKERPST